MNTLVTILITVGCTLLANVVFWSFFYGGMHRRLEEHTEDLAERKEDLRIHDQKLDELTKAVTRVATICEMYIGRNPSSDTADKLKAVVLELEMRLGALKKGAKA